MIGKELKCDLGQVFCFSNVMCFLLLVFTNTNRECSSSLHVTILFFIDLLYIVLDLVLQLAGLFKIFVIYHCLKE